MPIFNRLRNLPEVYRDPDATMSSRSPFDELLNNLQGRARNRAARACEDAIVQGAVQIFTKRVEAKVRDDAGFAQAASEESQRRRSVAAASGAADVRQVVFDIMARQCVTLQDHVIRQQEAQLPLIDRDIKYIETMVSKRLFTPEDATNRRQEIVARLDGLRRQMEAVAMEFADATIEECRSRGLLPSRPLR